MMTRKCFWVGLAGWMAFLGAVFCSTPGLDVEVRWTGEDRDGARAAAAREGPAEPLEQGRLAVVDANGTLVGLLLSRTHRLFEHNELFDAVTVYNPKYGLFFSIQMQSALVLRPAKVFFAAGNCTGTAAIRATCPDCVSGYGLAFSYNGQWYRVGGGKGRSQFSYSSYIAEETDAVCTGHGHSSTYVYPLDPLGPTEGLPIFEPPLRFVWGN